MSNLLRSLIVRVGLDAKDAQAGLKNLGKDLKSAGKDMTNTGASLTKGLTVPVLGAVAGLTGLAINAGNTADELLTMSQQTGLSTKRLQELQYASRFVDVEVETLTKSMAKNIKSMKAAQDGTALSVDAYKKLGVEVLNADGSMRDGQDVYWETIDALGKMTNETERDALGMQLLGKSAQDLNPLIKAGSKELKRLSEEAHTVGAVMEDETVVALGKFDDQMEKLEAVVKTAGGKIGAAFVPVLMKLEPVIVNKIVPAVQGFAGTITKLIDGFDKLSPTVQTIIGGIAGFAISIGPALTVMGKLSTGIGGVMTSLSGAVKVLSGGGGFTAALTTLIGPAGVAVLALAAIAGLALAYQAVSGEARAATADVQQYVDSIKASADAYKGQEQSISNNSGLAKDLTDKLFALEAIENKTNAQKAQMVDLVAQLNKLIPELGIGIDEETGRLNQNKKAVYELVEALKEQALVELSRDKLLNAYKAEQTTKEKLAEATDNFRKAQEAVNRLPKVQFMWQGSKERYELIESEKRVKLLTASLADQSTEIGKLENSHKVLIQSYSTVQDAQYEGTRDWANMASTVSTANNEIIESVEEATEDLAEQFEQQMTDRYKANADIRVAAQQHISQMGSLEDKGIQKTKLTAAEIKKNLQQQVKDFQQWRSDIQSLASRVPDDVLTELRALGPEMQPVIVELNNMTDKELKSWIEAWRAPAQAAREAAVQELAKLPGEAYTVGANVGNRFAAGLDSSLSAVQAAAKRFTTAGKVLSPNWQLVFGPGSLPQYASGTDYVPRTGPAIIHEGEAVLTKEENARRSSGGSIDYDRLGQSVARALAGMSINVDGRKFGEVAIDPVSRALTRRNLSLATR